MDNVSAWPKAFRGTTNIIIAIKANGEYFMEEFIHKVDLSSARLYCTGRFT